MMPLADLFVHVYVLIDEALSSGAVAIPPRPGRAPACTDAELLTIATVRHLVGRPSEAGVVAEVRRDWGHYVPHLPHQSEVNRRVRWLWGAFELLRQRLLDEAPEDDWQQVDTTARPVKHPSRVRGVDAWDGPGELHAGFGRDAAHGEWFSGFRLGLRTDLGSRLVRTGEIAPAAVDERAVADDLLGATRPAGLLLDRGFLGRAWADRYRAAGTRIVIAHSRAERRALPRAARRPGAALRTRIETTSGELTDALGLARHRATTFWGRLTRTAATIFAHSLRRLGRA
jgi:hypothetical protein